MQIQWLTTSEIEKQIADYDLRFDPLKDDEIEWRFQPPPFVTAFVAFINAFERIPSQTAFADYYIAINRGVLNGEFLSKWKPAERQTKKRALMARLTRAYPSFVRDVYLLALLREHGIAATYDLTQDVACGVDLVVSRGAQKISVHVFLASPRSWQGRAKKNRRHSFTGEHLDLVLAPNECKRVGAFWLPTAQHVGRIQNALTA